MDYSMSHFPRIIHTFHRELRSMKLPEWYITALYNMYPHTAFSPYSNSSDAELLIDIAQVIKKPVGRLYMYIHELKA